MKGRSNGASRRGQGSKATGEISDALGVVRNFIDERPYSAVGAALFAGYVLGGGLISEMTVRLVTLGMRIAAVASIRQAVTEGPLGDRMSEAVGG